MDGVKKKEEVKGSRRVRMSSRKVTQTPGDEKKEK